MTGVTDATDTALGLMLLVIRILPSLLLWGACTLLAPSRRPPLGAPPPL